MKTPLMIAAVVSVSVMAQVPGLEPEQDWDLNGYLKYMATATFPDGQSSRLDHLVHQRFNFEYRFNSDVRFNVGMRNRLLFGDTAETPGFGQLVGFDPPGLYGFVDQLAGQK